MSSDSGSGGFDVPPGGGGDFAPPPPPPPPPPPNWPYDAPPGGPQGAPPQGWQVPPNYGYPQGGYGPPPTTNGLAIASMVLGILWLYWIGSILALIFGYIAKRQIDQSQGRQSGRGMAVAGIVLGWIGVGLAVLLVGLGLAAFTASASGF